MKRRSWSILAVTLMFSPGIAVADIAYNVIASQSVFQQTSPGTLSGDGANFGLATAVHAPTDFTGVSVTYPGAVTPIDLTYSPRLNSNGTYSGISFGQGFVSVAAMNAAFPFGTYSFTGTNANTGATQTADAIHDFNHWPSAAPALTIASYSQIQGMDAGLAMMFSFNGFTADGFNPFNSARADPSAILFIATADGTPIYQSAPMSNPNGINYLLPSNTLLPGGDYQYYIIFSNIVHCGGVQACGTGMSPGFVLEFDMITYGSFTTSAAVTSPQTLVNFEGGTPQNPVPLPLVGHIGQLDGTIGGIGSTDFYLFYWHGGAFQASIDVAGATPGATYEYELLDAFGNVIETMTLDQSNNFIGTIDATLITGLFAIGLVSTSAFDPLFTIHFDTPVQGVPEPDTLALLVLALVLGGTMERAKRMVPTQG